jgi:hypothetical protein
MAQGNSAGLFSIVAWHLNIGGRVVNRLGGLSEDDIDQQNLAAVAHDVQKD